MSNDTEELEAEVEQLKAEIGQLENECDSRDDTIEELEGERDLCRRIVCEPTSQTADAVQAVGNKTAAACRVIDLFNLKSSHEAWIRNGRELRAEVAKLRQALTRIQKAATDIPLAHVYVALGFIRDKATEALATPGEGGGA